MSEWIYFIHPPRERFVETITEEEAGIMHTHAAHLGDLLEKGVLILAGPTFGEVNTGIAVIEAEDEGGSRAAGGNATAASRLVAAIPFLSAASPGLYDALDVPLSFGRGRLTRT